MKTNAIIARPLLGLSLLLLVLVSTDCRAGEIESLKLKFELRLEKASEPEKQLNQFYIESLGRLTAKVQKDGDLDALLQIKSEKKRIENPGQSRTEKVFPALAKQRAIYEKKLAEIRIDAASEKRELIEKYRGAIETYQTDYTKKGKIDLALECRSELERVDAIAAGLPNEASGKSGGAIGKRDNKLLVLSEWKTPHGGRRTQRSDAIGISGTDDKKLLAVAVAHTPLSKGSSLRGECRSNGQWTGFIVAASKDADTYLSIISVGQRQKAMIEVYADKTRRPKSNPAAKWGEADTWLPFELSVVDGEFQISIGDLKLSAPLPKDIKRHHVGIAASGASKIEVRKLQIVSPRAQK